ncbi:hypothetical protein PoB_004647300 [Plakobranchus ocellatus]|uniref:Uncharacterized protein n=1 Tax=Plakobranchus ocellatus TaxID=259542 RepID=A0AAV4BLC5_9GAST|nr:hypothetical protein PoB_004647300 [Plakobranchus ocellatus]
MCPWFEARTSRKFRQNEGQNQGRELCCLRLLTLKSDYSRECGIVCWRLLGDLSLALTRAVINAFTSLYLARGFLDLKLNILMFTDEFTMVKLQVVWRLDYPLLPSLLRQTCPVDYWMIEKKKEKEMKRTKNRIP